MKMYALKKVIFCISNCEMFGEFTNKLVGLGSSSKFTDLELL